MADSRNKGAAFERDLVKRLNTFFADNDLDLSCKRNLDQYQTAGMCDIEIPGHAIEAKAYKSGWWYSPDNAQTVVMTLDQWFILLAKYFKEGSYGGQKKIDGERFGQLY